MKTMHHLSYILKLLVSVTLLLVTAIHTGVAENAGAEIPAPNFELTGLDGKTIALKQYKGKVVVLNFWGTWCTPCRKELAQQIARLL